VEHKKN
jgi:chromosome segregation ATPase